VGDQLANLVLGDAVTEGVFEVTAQLPLAAECNRLARRSGGVETQHDGRTYPTEPYPTTR
jgi:hypothetical protein